jgi:putative transposase
MTTVSIDPRRGNGDFHRVTRSLLLEKGLPLGSVLPAAEIERIFRRHDGFFGDTYNGVYNTAVVLWAFLSQVLADGKMRSCAAAVARVIDFAILTDQDPPSTDTSAYCKARHKLDEKALHELLTEVAAKIEFAAADEWLWCGRHAKLVDGFTATMPDTPENQEAFPQQKSQKPGIGFPTMRACVILSLATACVLDAAFGPYSGKQTGEMALFRQLLDSFQPGDVAVFDRYYGSYMTLALLILRGVDACARLHQSRPRDFRRGKRLGKYDRLVTWERPKCPKWMDEATYATIPQTLTLRMTQFQIVEPGCRTKSVTIVTTLVDAEQYSKQDIAELYGFRWNVEVDILHIKQTLNLDHLRCKTPAMVRKEFWTTLLAYNLIRRIICAAAIEHGKLPRRISFTRTCVTILTAWLNLSLGLYSPKALKLLLKQIASLKTPHRPGRIEPRVLKRRRHRYPLMREPRHKFKQRLKSTTRSSKMT